MHRALQRYAAAGVRVAELAAALDAGFADLIRGYFERLGEIDGVFAEMAERELCGEPFGSEQLVLINRAVRIEQQHEACTTVEVPDGWYADLFFVRQKAIAFAPMIADVHTSAL